MKDPKCPLAAESKSDNCVGCIYDCLRFLRVAPVVIFGWITLPGHKYNRLSWYRLSIRCFSMFWSIPNTHLKQILKVIIMLGASMLVSSCCEWLLWSYVVELVCLDTNKTGCVDVDLLLLVLVFLEATQIPTCSRIETQKFCWAISCLS